MAIALETGNIDIAADLSLVEAPHLQEKSGLDVRIFPSKWLFMLEMNSTKEPWNNENIRKAIASCINLDDLILVVTQDTGVAHGSLTFEGSFGYPGYPTVKQDYNKAKEYLSAAGYPNGLTVTFNATEGTYKKIGEALQGMCAPAGINIDIVLTDSAAVIPMAMDNKHDLIPMTGSGLGADADSELVDKVVSGSWGNWSRINEPRIDELMTAARYEQDDARRRDMYLEVQQIVYDKCYIIPLYITALSAGCNSKLENFEPMANSLYNFYPMFWKEAK
jgi:peptide/nickel transport system substrate-binding protein